MSKLPDIPLNAVEYFGSRPLPRGVRNNNPGNIRLGDNWLGLCAEQADGAFCQFSEIKYGMRALAYILRVSYMHRQGHRTVRAIISRWAPKNENDTDAYIRAVARAMKLLPDVPLDINDDSQLGTLMSGIIMHENGAQPYSGMQIVSGIRMLPRTDDGSA